MHFVILARGAPKEFQMWREFMNSQMFWWKRQPLLKDDKGNFIPDGKDENDNPKYIRGPEEVTRVQGVLRPIQFFEYVFPKECLPEVLAMMKIHNAADLKLRPEVAGPAWFVRKLMKLKPVPVIPEIQGKNPQDITTKWVPTNAVATYPIGIREDFKKDFIFKLPNGATEGWYQEGL